MPGTVAPAIGPHLSECFCFSLGGFWPPPPCDASPRLIGPVWNGMETQRICGAKRYGDIIS